MYYCNAECRTLHRRQHQSDCGFLRNKDAQSNFIERLQLFVKNNPLANVSENAIQGEEKINFSKLKFSSFFDGSALYDSDVIEYKAYTNAIDIEGCHSVWNGMGQGLYLPVTLLKNSCRPNSYHIFRGTTLELRATRNIFDDEEITYCRADLTFM